MTEPHEISLLNLDTTVSRTKPDLFARKAKLVISFTISQQIKIEKRKVTSLPGLFGDLGGLYEFLATIIVVAIGSL